MIRSLFFAALLFTAVPASGQSVPTPDQRARMAANARALQDSLDDARREIASMPSGEDRTEAIADERLLRARRDVADRDLARADSLIDAARADAFEPAGREAEPAGRAGRDATPARIGPEGRAVRTDSVSESDGHRGPLSPWVLALFTVLFALVAGLGWWTLNQRRRVAVPVASRTAYGPGPGFGAPLPGQTVPRHEFDRLSEQVRSLAAEHRTLSDWVRQDYERRQTPAAPAPTPPAPVASAPTLAPADAAAAAFADWCRQGTPMMSRVDFFASHLGTAVPGASARAVYRDLNSQAEPVRFDDRGGASPAEFWLVSAGGETLLFPQPLNAGQFRDLTRVFEGTAAPKTVGHVAPARVRDEGGTFALTEPGRVG